MLIVHIFSVSNQVFHSVSTVYLHHSRAQYSHTYQLLGQESSMALFSYIIDTLLNLCTYLCSTSTKENFNIADVSNIHTNNWIMDSHVQFLSSVLFNVWSHCIINYVQGWSEVVTWFYYLLLLLITWFQVKMLLIRFVSNERRSKAFGFQPQNW